MPNRTNTGMVYYGNDMPANISEYLVQGVNYVTITMPADLSVPWLPAKIRAIRGVSRTLTKSALRPLYPQLFSAARGVCDPTPCAGGAQRRSRAGAEPFSAMPGFSRTLYALDWTSRFKRRSGAKDIPVCFIRLRLRSPVLRLSRATAANGIGEDDDVQLLDGTPRVHLTCPISLQRIIHPARGRQCAHLQVRRGITGLVEETWMF